MMCGNGSGDSNLPSLWTSLTQDQCSGQGGLPWLGHVLSGLFHADNQTWGSEHEPGFCLWLHTSHLWLGTDHSWDHWTRNWSLWERFRIARAVTSSPWCLSLPEHTRLALWAEAQGSSQEKCRRAANLPAARSLQVHAASRSTQPSVLHSQGMWCRERICKVWSLLASPGTALNGMCPALSCGISSNWCVCTPGLMEVFYMNCTGFGVCISSGFANYLSPMESNMLYHIQADILIMYYSLCWRN